jgi:DivIVA domain-containing protein
VDRPPFTRVRWREGYDIAEVDTFLERLLATAEGRYVEQPVTPDEIHQVIFTPVRLTSGYKVEEVDAFLEQAETLLRGS